ncbi:hypothetical protein [Pyruvatibacter sp.]|uniref:hypothetical protein n=1 Tax=Pyruvatibacter sp. TaxID=1981328 RepID=UPI0032EAC014
MSILVCDRLRGARVLAGTTVAIILLSSSLALAGKASRVQEGYVGCINDDALDEFIGAAIDKNQRQMDSLSASGQCFYVGGLEFDYVDAGFMTSEIRVYVPGGGSLVLFIPTEGTRE